MFRFDHANRPQHNASVFYGQKVLPPEIRSRFIDNSNGLAMHVLEAGFDAEDRPCLLLLHGFPELAFSWRKVMPTLAAAGYHVVAPDQRGYGRTTGWDASYDGDLGSFRLTNLVRDAIGLIAALGYRSVAAVCGHDFGSPVAAWCALLRPDIFRSAVLLSAPFAGPPALPFNTVRVPRRGSTISSNPRGAIQADLAALHPPRKHYQWYYSTRAANDNMQHAPQGVHEFLRARCPNCRRGCGLYMASGGGTARIQRGICADRFPGRLAVVLVDGAGHWVQQEQPEAVSAILMEFLRRQG